jgi:asparaginyl-tRNA synthetase
MGPYSAEKGGRIAYNGNNLFLPIPDVLALSLPTAEIEHRTLCLHNSMMWPAITRINHTINKAVNDYFDNLGASFVPLPLTTRMISSPGAVYGKEAISYTTDTCPITLQWFDLSRKAYLSESSQIYLELALLQKGIDQVYTNYHSFRKEESDSTHLSEFHHVEYEGHLDQRQNLQVIQGMLKHIVDRLLARNEADLAVFLSEPKLQSLESMLSKSLHDVTLAQALDVLYEDTKDPNYKEFTLQRFGAWEEIRLTQCLGGMVGVSEMPLLEIPFYHAKIDRKQPCVADNTDIIWPGYRETVGSGHRVRSISELEEKAETFQLPKADYEPYLQSRRFADYKESSGFGMGWERLLQGLLEMPFIHSASLFPRVHTTLKP